MKMEKRIIKREGYNPEEGEDKIRREKKKMMEYKRRRRER
jgi:hypothetical protein